MSRRGTERREVRGFRLNVEPTDDAFGVLLEETNGRPENTTAVVRTDATHTREVLGSVMGAVTQSGHARTTLGPTRKVPIALAEEAGLRLALVLLATQPVSKSRRIQDMVGGIDAMATEEAYYWYAKCMGPDAGRARRALRLLLAEE
jgi:hypothetical protein